jgi:hypothetical protein
VWGIDKIFFIAMAALCIGFFAVLMLTETLPAARQEVVDIA